MAARPAAVVGSSPGADRSPRGCSWRWPGAAGLCGVLGLAAALVDGLGRMLLQRSADPRHLGAVLSLVELVGGAGMLAGSGLAQVLLAVGEVDTALLGLAGALVVVLLLTALDLGDVELPASPR